MVAIVKVTTLEDIRRANPQKVYYSVNTCWWTHRQTDLRQEPTSGLPCDPRGGMVMERDNVEGFLKAAEENAEAYGRHGLDAFIAAHNDNCVVSPTDLRGTCLRTWDEYNELLDVVEPLPNELPTTHDQKVAMLREYTRLEVNEMWQLLLRKGTKKAIKHFYDAVIDAGYHIYWVKPDQEYNPDLP